MRCVSLDGETGQVRRGGGTSNRGEGEPAMTTTVLSNHRVLSDQLMERFGARAPAYDRENRFFSEDFDDLRLAGYLEIAVPGELGGRGMNLAAVCQEQRRLAYRAPATALATNMHIYWTGLAADLLRAGDTSCRWILEEAARGEVFAAGHGEGGNDFPVMLSTTRAERAEGGYRFYGHKIFGSLSPVWTRLGLHAMDTSDPAQPRVVHAFLPRDTDGYRIVPTWDVLGMRATRSDDTILEGAFVPDRYIPRVVPAGLAGADLFVLGIFAWAEPTFANYIGDKRRHRAQGRSYCAADHRGLPRHAVDRVRTPLRHVRRAAGETGASGPASSDIRGSRTSPGRRDRLPAAGRGCRGGPGGRVTRGRRARGRCLPDARLSPSGARAARARDPSAASSGTPRRALARGGRRSARVRTRFHDRCQRVRPGCRRQLSRAVAV